MLTAKILVGDVRERLADIADGSVRTCVTSPPYWNLRDYGHDGQLGLEQTPQEFVENLCQVFDEVWRVLADDGTLWVNLGDTYANTNRGHNSNGFGSLNGSNAKNKAMHAPNRNKPLPENLKQKDLVGIPWRFAFAMQDRGWYLRQDIIWAKPNPMPESVTDRCTKSHEYVFLLTKSARYYYNANAIKEQSISSGPRGGSLQNDTGREEAIGMGRIRWKGERSNNWAESGRNKRSVWKIATKPFNGAHFAVMPEALVEPCVLAGSAPGDTVLDPFSGAATVGVVANRHQRNYVGCELNPDYVAIAENRLRNEGGMFVDVVIDEKG